MKTQLGKLRKKFAQLVSTALLVASLTLGVTTAANAISASYGDSLCGASTTEILGVGYKGAAWRYSGSSYKWAKFSYSRDNKVIVSRITYGGKVSAFIWDDPRWGDKYVTKFSWDRGK